MLILIERSTFHISLTEESIAERPNIFTCKFFMAVKHNGGTEICKARFLIGRHRDRENDAMLHPSYNLKNLSVKPLFALAKILGFDVCDLNVKQTYLQSGSKLQRKVFIKAEIIELDHDEVVQIMRALYGLSESGDYWCERIQSSIYMNYSCSRQPMNLLFSPKQSLIN